MDEARFKAAEAALWASVDLAPVERHVRLARTGLTVRIQEVGDGPLTLFVHGAVNSGVSWANLVAGLPNRRCVAIDRPGCGLSEAPAAPFRDPEELGAFADTILVDLLDGIGADSADLVVTSYGGWFGLRTAAAHPDRVDRMVLLGWSLGVPPDRLPLVMRLAGVPGAARIAGLVPPSRSSVRSLLRRVGLREAIDAGRFPDEAIDAYLALLRHTDTMANEIRMVGSMVSLRRGFDDGLLLDDAVLASIQAPTYFLWGEGDPFGGPATARRFVDRVPGAELELFPGAGHAPWIDDADHVAMTVNRFLDG